MNDDTLKLNVSSTFTLVDNNEANINLNLAPPTVTTEGTVTGTVYDTTLLTGAVVPGATVKVFTTDGTPYAHTITDINGQYTISDLPMGIYTIAAVKDGNYLSQDLPLTISSTLPVTIDLVLTNNESITKNIVYGIVDDNLNNSPIDNVTVSLYQIVDGEKVLVSTTTSIADGEFILDQIADGTYSLSFSKAGYQTVEVNNVILTGSTKFDASTTLTSTIGTINSTVSGYIKNELGIAVANAYVGLYQIVAAKETLVAVTYTNADGKYMFGNVVEGQYVVKSKLSTTL